MSDPVLVNIARCPEHGLHGCREKCFVCDGPVEQVPMVPAPLMVAALDRMDAVRDYLDQVPREPHHVTQRALYRARCEMAREIRALLDGKADA